MTPLSKDGIKVPEFDAEGGFRDDRRPEVPMLSDHLGDYELIQELGRGDIGIVYKARHLGLKRLVSRRMVRAGAVSAQAGRRRFRNEAEVAAMLDHPHIVPIFEVGEIDERRYIGMKLIGGPNLDRKLGEFTADQKV
jgi:eukaryotic-like serine/threonine-protein kinase